MKHIKDEKEIQLNLNKKNIKLKCFEQLDINEITLDKIDETINKILKFSQFIEKGKATGKLTTQEIDNAIIELDIEKHDRCASIISHVPHVTAAALVTLLNRAGDDLDSCLKLIGGGFKDTTRIASSNADMWADICITNADAIAANLRDLQGILGEVIKSIDTRDRQAIHDYFSASKSRRDEILQTVEKKFDPN